MKPLPGNAAPRPPAPNAALTARIAPPLRLPAVAAGIPPPSRAARTIAGAGRLLLWTLGTLSVAAVATHAPAAEAPPTHACAEVVRSAERLACFDRAFPPGAAARQAAAAMAVDDFGKDREGATASATPRTLRVGQFQARVARVTHGTGGGRTVDLDNGQVWELSEATQRGPLAPGDAVVVRRAAMGSYLLVTPAGVPLRVRRLR